MKLIELSFWILFTLGIAVVVWLIIGNTPTLEQALLVLTISLVINNTVEIKGVKKDIFYLKRQFGSMARDFKDVKNIIAKR